MPDPGEVAARAEMLYWKSLTPEQQAEELRLKDSRSAGFKLKSSSQVAIIVARQNALLGSGVAGTLLLKTREASSDFFERVRSDISAKRAVSPALAVPPVSSDVTDKLRALVIQACSQQRHALQVSRFASYDKVGALQMQETAVRLREAAGLLEDASDEILKQLPQYSAKAWTRKPRKQKGVSA